MVVDIADAVNYANFGDHRLRGFWVAGGQISPSPIDFHRRPYNTLALPCECVMDKLQFLVLIIVKKLNSLKHLVRTTALNHTTKTAKSQQEVSCIKPVHSDPNM